MPVLFPNSFRRQTRVHKGYWTLRYQDISVLNHFGTGVKVSRDTSVLMPKWSGHLGPSTEMFGDTPALIVSR